MAPASILFHSPRVVTSDDTSNLSGPVMSATWSSPGMSPRDGDNKTWTMPVQMTGAASIDEGEVRRALSLMVDPDHWVQIQTLPSKKFRHIPGHDLEWIVKTVAEFSKGVGCYVSLNPYKGPLEKATRNTDVTSRRWFLIDPDAEKPTGKNSSTTDVEKEASRQVTESVRDYLREKGWPDPIFVDSGNNWQLLYRIDLPNDRLSQQLLKRCLLNLIDNFNTPIVKIDDAVHDARRICKIPGTMVRKGPNAPDRPWRMSRLISVPMSLEVVPEEKIRELACGGTGPLELPVDTEEPEAELYDIESETPKAPSQKPEPQPWSMKVGSNDQKSYIRAVVEREVGRVATATNPGRNTTLHDAAWRIASIYKGGDYTREEIFRMLAAAGEACGLGDDGDRDEVQRAIRNGFDWGENNPRQVPERQKSKEKTRAKAKIVGGEAPTTETPDPETIHEQDLVICAADVETEDVNWLWPNRVPFGFITIFAGRTGIGKSFIAFEIAARLSCGDSLPGLNGECLEPGNVLIISEDPMKTMLAPRLLAMGANMRRCFFMTWTAMLRYQLDDIDMLTAAVRMAGEATLVIIDPPTNFLGEKDEHKNTDVRQVLMRLVSWLDTRPRPTACIMITHVNKNSGQGVDAINRIIGSVAWSTTSRIAHTFAVDASAPGQCLFSCPKNNLGPLPKTLGYRIVPDGGLARVDWLGEVDITADDAMSGEKKKPRGIAAVDWLAERFREKKEWPSEDLKEAAANAGLSKNALWSPEVQALPIRKTQVTGEDGTRYWAWQAHPGWPAE
jgi:hypothetical protein